MLIGGENLRLHRWGAFQAFKRQAYKARGDRENIRGHGRGPESADG